MSVQYASTLNATLACPVVPLEYGTSPLNILFASSVYSILGCYSSFPVFGSTPAGLNHAFLRTILFIRAITRVDKTDTTSGAHPSTTIVTQPMNRLSYLTASYTIAHAGGLKPIWSVIAVLT